MMHFLRGLNCTYCKIRAVTNFKVDREMKTKKNNIGIVGLHNLQDIREIKVPSRRGCIVADTNVSPFARALNICCGYKFCVRDTKNVSDFVQKHFVSATNVSQFAKPKKHHGQQCVCSNVSSFTRALSLTLRGLTSNGKLQK